MKHITVGAAVTLNSKNEVLIAQRLDGDAFGGLWEFPGGKLEKGETITECIARELMEELGIEISIGEHLLTVDHKYEQFFMTMHVYLAKIVAGKPKPIQCANCRWVDLSDFRKYKFSVADLKVVANLQESF